MTAVILCMMIVLFELYPFIPLSVLFELYPFIPLSVTLQFCKITAVSNSFNSKFDVLIGLC